MEGLFNSIAGPPPWSVLVQVLQLVKRTSWTQGRQRRSTNAAECHQVVSLKSPVVIICPDCLTGRYCNKDCERNGREKHKTMCQHLAYRKLNMVHTAVVGNTNDFVGWMKAVRQSLSDKRVLPDCCTEEQLDELSVLWPRCYSMILPDPTPALKVLELAIHYALLVARPAARVTRLVHDCGEVLKAVPPASDEEGADMWGCQDMFVLCLNVGSLLSRAGRPRDAVNFIQSVKPNLEVALLVQKDRQGVGNVPLCHLLTLYAEWLKECLECLREKLTRAEYRAHPDRQKRIELLKQAIKLGKGQTAEVARCALELGTEYLQVEDIDLALQVFQKSLKLPWNVRSGRMAVKAVECHIMAGRDTQAGKWMGQLLRLEEHCPGRLSLFEQRSLYNSYALLYGRRRQADDALSMYVRALDMLGRIRAGNPEMLELDIMLFDLTMDKVNCLDALGHKDSKGAEFWAEYQVDGLRWPLEELRVMQSLVGKGQEVEALEIFEDFNDQMMRQTGYHYRRWRFNGITLWGMEMLGKWEGLVIQLLPEGERRAAVLERIEEMKGLEEEMKQKLSDDRRAQAIVEVREQVTGKPASEGEGILEGAGEATGEAADEATGEETPNPKPSKAAKKKRKERQKKAAQAQHDSSQQGAEAGLEQSMAGLDIKEDEVLEGEGQAGGEDNTPTNVTTKEECVICLNELGGEEKEEALTCGHVLHASCLRCWASKCASLSIETTCPMCREPVASELHD